MPFVVRFSIDEDKQDPASPQAGDIHVSYNSPQGAESPLGHWSYSGRYEAGSSVALEDVCAQFEAWQTKRLIEIGIETSIKSALDPLCPCHEEPELEEEPEPEPEP